MKEQTRLTSGRGIFQLEQQQRKSSEEQQGALCGWSIEAEWGKGRWEWEPGTERGTCRTHWEYWLLLGMMWSGGFWGLEWHGLIMLWRYHSGYCVVNSSQWTELTKKGQLDGCCNGPGGRRIWTWARVVATGLVRRDEIQYVVWSRSEKICWRTKDGAKGGIKVLDWTNGRIRSLLMTLMPPWGRKNC